MSTLQYDNLKINGATAGKLPGIMADEQPIDDALLSKFLAGETDPAESARIRAWLASRNDNQVDTDATWRAVRQKMRTTDRNPVSRSKSVRKPVTVQRMEERHGWSQTKLQLAAVLALVASFGWLLYQFRSMSQDHPADHIVTLVTNNQKISKTLPDGTRILLNRHSMLTYPGVFADDQREVTLTGEAFFEVTPDVSRPFRIEARKSVVQVLGTSFSVRSYDANVSVAVQMGNVLFSRGKSNVLLAENQQATFEPILNTIRRMQKLEPNAFAYKTGQLIFNDEPLRDVIQAINQFYNADVQLANDQLGNCRLTTRFDKTSLAEVLAVMAKTLSLHVRREGRQVILEGAGCQIP